MIEHLQGKTAFITGGSRGIGKSIAMRIAKAGAKVALCARREALLNEAVDELKTVTPDVLGIPADVSVASQVESCVQQIESAFGPIDILVNNAGIYRFGNVTDTTLDEWESQFAINLKGPFLVTQVIAERMKEHRSGRIIFISSAIAVVSPPANALYTATKRGLEGFAGSIAQELCDYGITCHVVRPGFTDTPIFDDIGKPDWDIDWIAPDEIAEAVDFLCRLPKHAQVPELNYITTFQRITY